MDSFRSSPRYSDSSPSAATVTVVGAAVGAVVADVVAREIRIDVN
jgi:hypothetical protein